MATITHVTIALHSETERPESARGLGRVWRIGSKGSWVKLMLVCVRQIYSDRKKSPFYLRFISETVYSFSLFFFKIFIRFWTQLDFPLSAAEMESLWFSLSTGQRRVCSTLQADIMFFTYHFVLDYLCKAKSLNYFCQYICFFNPDCF